jgi:hypothetical protein
VQAPSGLHKGVLKVELFLFRLEPVTTKLRTGGPSELREILRRQRANRAKVRVARHRRCSRKSLGAYSMAILMTLA